MDSNLAKARSSIVWILAIVVAFSLVWWIERESGRALIARQPPAAQEAAAATPAVAPSTDIPPVQAPRALTPQERQWAQAAWAYFEKNTDATTGLAPSVDTTHSATLWDMASHLLALQAARDLALVDPKAFDERMDRALASLAKLPLYGNALPNKSYDVRSLAMTDYAGQPSTNGIGWSAIDIGRLLVPLNVIAWQHPQHTAKARAVIARWDMAKLVRDGQLIGMQAEGATPQELQEGRLGYEQYAAHTLRLAGLDVGRAADWRAQLQIVDVEGVGVPVDRRDPKQFGAQNHVVSEPWILAGLEYGWDREAREYAWRVYKAQEARFRKTGILTAVSEDHVDQAPFFVYNAVHNGGRTWVAVTEKGEDATHLRSLSVKAAFGWHALLRTGYTGKLVDAVAALHDPARGWQAGLYEEGKVPNKAVTANTNGVVLEALAYIARGKALRYQ